jgi:uncharacterized protein YcbK (DUF882 family)
MALARRAFLRTSGAALLAAGTVGIRSALAAPAARRLSFENLHTGERLALDYWNDGAYHPEALAAINKVLRDFRTGDVHAIDPRLLDLLHDVNARLETAAPFQVISGYRSPRTNGMLHEQSSGVASKSLHMQGMAIDIRVPGRELTALHGTALALGRGGVGFYPTSDFVHIDVGRVRKWNGV